MTFDLLLKSGTVFDGTGNNGQRQDVGIAHAKIVAIGDLHEAKATRVISAENKYVVPGFVDIQNHSDSYLTLLETPGQDSLVSQGITTIAVGHCGTSLAPLSSLEALKSVQKWHSLAGANLNWSSFAEYLTALQNYPLGLNVLSLVGHSTLRRGLLGDAIRPATPEEVKIMARLLSESLASGTAGLSLGLIYAHEVDAGLRELQELTQMVSQKNKLLSVHLRSESTHVVDALEEALGLLSDSLGRVKISHFKIQRQANWQLLEQALSRIDRAYQKGMDVFFDVYPYSTSWTVLYTYLPKWAYEGGRAAILQNLQEKTTREKILTYLRGQEQSFGDVFIATAENNHAFTGKTLSQVAANQEISVEEALLNVIAATNAQVIVFDHNLSEENVNILLKHPLSLVATDGAGYDFNFSAKHGLVHPRCFGTMPKFLAKIRDEKLMSWADAIKKISSRPAEKLGLQKRGQLREGYFADVVVFDPEQIGSRASYENPYQQADGIELVLVNGRIAFAANETTKYLAGQVLRV